MGGLKSMFMWNSVMLEDSAGSIDANAVKDMMYECCGRCRKAECLVNKVKKAIYIDRSCPYYAEILMRSISR